MRTEAAATNVADSSPPPQDERERSPLRNSVGIPIFCSTCVDRESNVSVAQVFILYLIHRNAQQSI